MYKIGKTVQLCTHYSSVANEEMYRLQSGVISTKTQYPLLLVVCPATIQQHWLEEFHRWAPRLRVLILHSISPTFSALSTLGVAAIKRAITKISSYDRNLNCMGIVMIVSYEGLRTLQKVLLNIQSGGEAPNYLLLQRKPDSELITGCLLAAKENKLKYELLTPP